MQVLIGVFPPSALLLYSSEHVMAVIEPQPIPCRTSRGCP